MSIICSDSETGEIFYEFPSNAIISYKTPEEEQRKAEQAEKRRGHEFYYRRENGERFVFVDSSEPRFEALKPATVAKLIYLSTYVNYDNKLMLGYQNMKRKNLKDVLGVSRWTADKFYEDVNGRYVFDSGSGGLSLNPSFFWKGKLKKKNMNPMQQLYINAVRSLYESANGKHHSQLGYIFMMLPFINREWNVICNNPFETDIDKVEPLTIKEFCKAIGYDVSQVGRLIGAYDRLTFTADGKEQKFCLFVNDGCNNCKSKVIVNPNILYVGSNKNRVEVFKLFFKE